MIGDAHYAKENIHKIMLRLRYRFRYHQHKFRSWSARRKLKCLEQTNKVKDNGHEGKVSVITKFNDPQRGRDFF